MSRVVRVLPDVPTLALDDGFLYTIGDDAPVGVGSTVRVPLGGRTVRGTVLAVGEGEPEGLKPVASLSPSLRQFDEPHLALHRWLARYYVAPLAAVLRSAAPPNLPRSTAPIPPPERGHGGRHHILTADHRAAVAAVVEETAEDGSVLVVCPTEQELESIAAGLSTTRPTVVVRPSDAAAAETAAWVTARTTPGCVVLGTPRVATWPVAGLATAICVDDGRRGHKSRQSPTLETRTVLGQRTRFEGVRLVTTGVVPTVAAIANGAEIIAPGPGRRWGPVEVVDRNEDPPGTGLLGRRTEVVVAGAAKAGARVIVFTHRRGYAPAFRCVACSEIRRCPACGTRATLTAACARCGAPLGNCAACGGSTFEPLGAAAGVVADRLRHLLGSAPVGLGPEHRIAVLTERDLPAVGPADLAVVVDADGLLLGPSYRSAEDGLRLLARVATRVRPGSGHRCLVQTAVPTHPVIEVLRRGDPRDWIEHTLAERAELGYPPAGELIVVEVRGDAADDPIGPLADSDAMVLGPLAEEGARRWLVQGRDLGRVRDELRLVARRIRDRGGEVRIDVDPLDL